MQGRIKYRQQQVTAYLQQKNPQRKIDVFKTVGMWLLWGGVGYLFGGAKTIFNTNPFGIALLCAGEGEFLPILVGLSVQTVRQTQNRFIWMSTYLSAGVIRLFGMMLRTNEPDYNKGRYIRKLLDDNTLLRVSLATVCQLMLSLYRIIMGGFRYYDWFAASFSLFAVALCTVIFRVWITKRQELGEAVSVCEIAFGAILIHAAGSSIPGWGVLSIGLFCSFWIGGKKGWKWGLPASALFGLVYAPEMTPAFLAAGVVLPLLEASGYLGSGVVISVLWCLVWTVYRQGVGDLGNLIPAFLLVGTVYTVYRKAGALPSSDDVDKKQTQFTKSSETLFADTDKKNDDLHRKMKNVGQACHALSEMFYRISDRLRYPDNGDLQRICDSAWEQECTDCPKKEICSGVEYCTTQSAQRTVLSELQKNRLAKEEQLPAEFRKRCEKLSAVLKRINRDYTVLADEMLRNNRTEILAGNYEGIEELLQDFSKCEEAENRVDYQAVNLISDIFKERKIRYSQITVLGSEKPRILITGVKKAIPKEVLEEVEDGLKLRLQEEKDGIYKAGRSISIQGAKKVISAEEHISGDTVNSFFDGNDRFFLLISDGMGCGRDAALVSNLCSTFCESMLRAGASPKTVLKMLNHMMVSRYGDSRWEYSATVDLLDVNLINGKASFYKGGAAPSFLLHNGIIEKIDAASAPVGILQTLNLRSLACSVSAGDRIVMISDGVLQEDEDGINLQKTLLESRDLSAEETVKNILRSVAEKPNHDDLSVVVLDIAEADITQS